MAMDVGFHIGRDQVSYRFLSLDQIPDLCGRDVQIVDFLKGKRMTGGVNPFLRLRTIQKVLRKRRRESGPGSVLPVPGLGHDDVVAEREKVPKFLPGLNFHEGILSHDEKEISLFLLPEIPDGVNGIGFPSPFELNVRDKKIRISGRGDVNHLEPVSGVDKALPCLVRRVGGRDKDYFLKSEGLPNVFRSPEMTQMDGIEGSSKQPNPFSLSFFSDLPLPLSGINPKSEISPAAGRRKRQAKRPLRTNPNQIPSPNAPIHPKKRVLMFRILNIRSLSRHFVLRVFVLFSPDLSFSIHNELRGRQLLQSHGAEGMKFRGADPDLGAQTEFITVIEPC